MYNQFKEMDIQLFSDKNALRCLNGEKKLIDDEGVFGNLEILKEEKVKFVLGTQAQYTALTEKPLLAWLANTNHRNLHKKF